MAEAAGQTVDDVGEFRLVAAITERFPVGPGVVLGPGDDAAVVAIETGEVVTSVDMLVEGRHFRRDWSAAADIGHKAAAESMSDVNAMGGLPVALLVGLGCPGETSVPWLLELAEGLAEEAATAGASVVGGDVVAGSQVTLSVTVLGRCDHGVVRRAGAQPGDVVAFTGRLGWAEAGLAVLGRGFRSPRAVVDAHRRPAPPYGSGAVAARHGATAMIDVSDGLLADLGHVAVASRVAIDVVTASLEVAEPIQAVGAALGVDPLGLLVRGGEDFGLAATFPAPAGAPDGWTVIGQVVGADSAGTVTVDGQEYDGPRGHAHFG